MRLAGSSGPESQFWSKDTHLHCGGFNTWMRFDCLGWCLGRALFWWGAGADSRSGMNPGSWYGSRRASSSGLLFFRNLSSRSCSVESSVKQPALLIYVNRFSVMDGSLSTSPHGWSFLRSEMCGCQKLCWALMLVAAETYKKSIFPLAGFMQQILDPICKFVLRKQAVDNAPGFGTACHTWSVCTWPWNPRSSLGGSHNDSAVQSWE